MLNFFLISERVAGSCWCKVMAARQHIPGRCETGSPWCLFIEQLIVTFWQVLPRNCPLWNYRHENGWMSSSMDISKLLPSFVLIFFVLVLRLFPLSAFFFRRCWLCRISRHGEKAAATTLHAKQPEDAIRRSD